ncbi:MAG: XRE family transcriptional regulator, partial [Acidimicrobiales bacterium]
MPEYRLPGQLIAALLHERGWDKQVLSAVLGIDKAGVSRLISGKKRIDAAAAIALAEVFDTAPQKFLDLQQAYDLEMARYAMPSDEGRATRAALFAKLPIAEMINRRWLNVDSVRNIPEIEAALAKFFGVEALAEIQLQPHAAKKSDTLADATPAQRAWIRRVVQIARGIAAPRYSRAAAIRAVERLQELLFSAEEARHTSRILAEAGIRFVIVESLKSAKIDGVCCWLDDYSPVIGISLRFDRIDNFWFVLRHEIEHVLNNHGKDHIFIDAELEGERAGTGQTVQTEERIANRAAADFCVPTGDLENFIARKEPIFA